MKRLSRRARLTEQGFGIGSNGFPGFKPSQAGEYSRRNYAAYVDVEAPFTEDFLMGCGAYALKTTTALAQQQTTK